MKWSEIKRAAEQAGIKEDDEISAIHCEMHHGARRFHILKLGRFIRLVEDFSESARSEASGCTC
jgi:hypothetical protein